MRRIAFKPVARLSAVVSAVLYTGRGDVLLQLRDDRPELKYPNHWTLFGGAVEPGEAPVAAVHRELAEELELDVPLTLWRAFPCPDRSTPDRVVMHYSFHGRLDRPLASLTLREGQAMRLVGRDEAATLRLAFRQQALLLAFFDTVLSQRRGPS